MQFSFIQESTDLLISLNIVWLYRSIQSSYIMTIGCFIHVCLCK